MKKTTTSKKAPGRKAKPAPKQGARPTVKRDAKVPVEQPAPAAVKVTKKDAVLALLQREDGATLAELMSATG